MDVFGCALPADTAPYEQQVFSDVCEPERTRVSSSSMVSVYRRLCLVDMHSDPLVDLDNNLQLIPAAAESREPSEDGLTWTFHLRPGQFWNDDEPVTAHDWVSSYQLTAAPETA